jgi:glycosyltransferase involved in cell wall biosynthesis
MTSSAEQRSQIASVPDPASISVVIPTFNDVGRIGDALQSIVNQTTPPGEVVVADDGSDDGTDGLVRAFAAQHAGATTVRYVRLPARSGAATARNLAIAVARGDWIANCDSDDVWAPTKLERQVAFWREWRGSRRLTLLGTYGYNINDAKRVISAASMGPTSESEYDALRQRGAIFFVIHSSALFSRADFFAIGGYTSEYGAADDYPFFCRMADRGVVVNMTEPLVYYRKRTGSVQLAHFWDLRREVARLSLNEQRRAAGEAAVSSAEYAAQLASAPAWKRVKQRKRVWGMYYYRSGTTDMVNGLRVRGACKLLLASILDWGRLRAGVINAARNRWSRKSRADPEVAPRAPAMPAQRRETSSR